MSIAGTFPPSQGRRKAAVAKWSRLVGRSAAARKLEESIARVSQFDCSVLVTGETGCGKEEIARAIHAAGPRGPRPFVAVNCGALVSTLAESQLFGHEKGSFTNAIGRSLGAFRAADGGILFLDEIGEMPIEMQPKLLRVLQQREVSPVGSSDSHRVDVQVIAATNQDLEAQVDRGGFREDLLYRLNTVHLTIPPLRERKQDIPDFISHFSAHFAEVYGLPRWRPLPEVLAKLTDHPWPGNVRQLAQTIQRLYVFQDRADELLQQLFSEASPSGEAVPEPPEDRPTEAIDARLDPGGPKGPPEQTLPVFNLAELRRLAVRQCLAATNGHKGQAASLLGVSLNTMTRLVAEACPEQAVTKERRSGRPGQSRSNRPK